MIRKLEVKFRQILWVLSKIMKPTTYDFVWFEGKEFFIKSSLCGEDKWNLFETGNTEPIFAKISGRHLKVKHSLSRFIRVYKDLMRFQKSSWGRIDYQNPIGTRLSYLGSDNIYFRSTES